MQFQIGGGCGLGWSLVVCVWYWQTSILGKGSDGIECGQQLVGLSSIPWQWTGVQSYGWKGSNGFLQCNGHRSTTTVSKPRPISCYPHLIPLDSFPRMLVYQCHTQTTRLRPRQHLPPIWNCISTRPPILTHSRSQHPLAPKFHPHPSGTKRFQSVSCILLLKKATVIWPKYSLSFCFISICLTDVHPQAGRRSCLS